MRKCWLVKQEPSAYPFARLLEERRTTWDGVRNAQARNALRDMRRGDAVLYYHSGSQKAVVGLARVSRAAFPDPSSAEGNRSAEGDWLAVELEGVKALAAPVGLPSLKADAALAGLPLLRQPRLSVMRITAAHFQRVLALGRT